ncbi:hypothetical protein TrST_g9053 [Triparma strigata]|uniref:Uncharacterized protein n=1 Tax=Triparma strigata TaxID=1606541 RepID=A0A9W6ZTV0_9STRA|nr:hypothetical protein TrST_g9053 [Triparma strigata]
MSQNQATPKMKKMSVEDQGCFMIIAESCHPGQRLAYPNSAKVLAGLTSHIVNRFMEADTVEICLAEIFGEGELLDHAVNNVTAVAKATDYPGNLYTLLKYMPCSDKITTMQIVATIEYVCTEILALAGAISEKLQDQPQWKNDKREVYEDYPAIRPSDLKAAVANDAELKRAFGALFKV